MTHAIDDLGLSAVLDVGNVVLFGTQPKHWYVGASPAPDSCYVVSSHAAFDDPDALILVFSELPGVGIRVPKAPGFVAGSNLMHEGAVAGQYISLGGVGFCLDDHGRAVRGLAAASSN